MMVLDQLLRHLKARGHKVHHSEPLYSEHPKDWAKAFTIERLLSKR